ncbi:unnamed protein product [Darwinula stevensoni]|uniref:Uncharacterized protein n=1 Tax=Darwinula stevensoni TaxID=69355 RepID=A0A7R8XCJ2_9CRUS|nr:unnamed protein product [Darwinula stevensoni]CAG0892049.1 unnamed protein product [Darwinula stevensoni]
MKLQIYNFKEELEAEMGLLWGAGAVCDVLLVCQDGKLKAHSALLMNVSDLFKDVLSRFPAAEEKVVFLPDECVRHVLAFLQLIYHGETSRFLNLGDLEKLTSLFKLLHASFNNLGAVTDQTNICEVSSAGDETSPESIIDETLAETMGLLDNMVMKFLDLPLTEEILVDSGDRPPEESVEPMASLRDDICSSPRLSDEPYVLNWKENDEHLYSKFTSESQFKSYSIGEEHAYSEMQGLSKDPFWNTAASMDHSYTGDASTPSKKQTVLENPDHAYTISKTVTETSSRKLHVLSDESKLDLSVSEAVLPDHAYSNHMDIGVSVSVEDSGKENHSSDVGTELMLDGRPPDSFNENLNNLLPEDEMAQLSYSQPIKEACSVGDPESSSSSLKPPCEAQKTLTESSDSIKEIPLVFRELKLIPTGKIPIPRLKPSSLLPASVPSCNACKMRFHSSRALKTHIKESHSQPGYRCPTCGSFFLDYHSRRYHIKKEHTELNFQCKSCEENFPTKYLLQKHERTKHPKPVKEAFS